mmetsp:Transcript_4616/g.10133  ORF Transcript_4616/g.10133 Transcript_4616/m.10133 type:complete len:266 (+) Transcript_4616:74-871(+)
MLWSSGYQADVTGTNMPATPATSSTITPAPRGTPRRSAAPGLAIIESAVIVAKRPEVIKRACGTAIGATASAILRSGASDQPASPVKAAKRPVRSAIECVCLFVYMRPMSGTIAARPGISGETAPSGVAMAKIELPAAMPMPAASVPYTLRMCATTPLLKLSHCVPVCCCLRLSWSSVYVGKTDDCCGLPWNHPPCCCCCCCCCCWLYGVSASFSSTSTRFFTFVNREGPLAKQRRAPACEPAVQLLILAPMRAHVAAADRGIAE